MGKPALPIPDHPKVRHLGFVSEDEKFALLAGCDVLLMPSAYESLSVIVLEAWAMGRPGARERGVQGARGAVRPQRRRAVLPRVRGVRGGAAAPARAIAALGNALGAAGRDYVRREYDWDVVESRVEGFFESLLKR